MKQIKKAPIYRVPGSRVGYSKEQLDAMLRIRRMLEPGSAMTAESLGLQAVAR